MRPLSIASIAALSIAGLSSASAAFSLAPLWSLSPGDRPYLTTDNTQRGMAYNPVTNHVLVLNRAGGLSVNVLDGNTGADLGTLDVSGIAGGTFPANMIGVGADGAVYVGNLTVSSSDAAPYRLYRWASEAATPSLAYSGNLAAGQRFGDTIAVRGSGTNTQVALGSGSNVTGTSAAILTTADGANFTPTVATVPADSTRLGITFGSGNTIWGTSSGQALREWMFDLGVPSATETRNYGGAVVPSGITAIGYDPVRQLLGGVDIATHTLKVYDVSGADPVEVGSEAFPTTNGNGNGVGAVAFGNGKLYALDTNNGIVAFSVIPEPSTLVFLLGSAIGLLGLRRRA